MKADLKTALDFALERVALCKMRIICMQYAIGDGNIRYRVHEADYGSLYSALFDDLNQAYLWLFVIGLVIGGKAAQTAALEAHKHFLTKSSQIMHLFNMDLRSPSGWLVKEEEEFRKEIEGAMKELVKQ